MDHGVVSPKKSLGLWLVLGAAATAACTTSTHVLVGQRRAPLPSREVRVYLEPVSDRYETIALVDASSRNSFSWTAVAKADVVMERLRSEAAKLGANGVVLQEITGGGGSVGAGVAPDLTRDHASIGLGFSAAGLLESKHGSGVAIYIAPAPAPPSQ